MKLLGPIKHLDNRMRRSAYLRQHKERMLQGQVVQPISPIQQATRETTAKSQRPSDKINLINEDISKLEKLQNHSYLNSTLDHLLTSKFSKMTSPKDNKNSIFLGASGTKGLVDIVDHDKLMETLNSEIKYSQPLSQNVFHKDIDFESMKYQPNRHGLMTPTDKNYRNKLLTTDKNADGGYASNISSLERNYHPKREHRSRVKERRDRPQFLSSSFVRNHFPASDMAPSLVASPKSQTKFAKSGQGFFNKRKNQQTNLRLSRNHQNERSDR